MKRFALIGGVLALTACEQGNSMSAQYKCENGTAMTVEFKDGKQVSIISEAGTVTLPRVEAASGVKYESEGVVFWSKGIDAAYSVPGQPATMCRR